MIVTIPVVALQSKGIIPLNGIDFSDLTPSAKKEVECLADNIYFESAYEPTDGKIAVGLVTLNRVKHGFENSVCGVVKQKVNYTCQFSWWCEDKPRVASISRRLTDAQLRVYNSIRDLAMFVYLNDEKVEDITRGATYYHADYVKPGWRHLQKTVKIGRHIFYKNGEVDTYDEQAKLGAKAGQTSTLIFSPNGRNHDGYLQTGYRMDF